MKVNSALSITAAAGFGVLATFVAQYLAQSREKKPVRVLITGAAGWWFCNKGFGLLDIRWTMRGEAGVVLHTLELAGNALSIKSSLISACIMLVLY